MLILLSADGMDTSSRDTAQAVSLLDPALPSKPLYLTARRQGICTDCWMHSPFLVRVCMQAFFPGMSAQDSPGQVLSTMLPL